MNFTFRAESDQLISYNRLGVDIKNELRFTAPDRDSYTNAFLFFSSVKWANSLWRLNYIDANLSSLNENDRFELPLNLISNTFTRIGGKADSFFQTSFVKRTKLKFFETRLLTMAERLGAVSNSNFLRLFLADKAVYSSFYDRNTNKTNSVFENLFYSSFFVIRDFDNFYSKDFCGSSRINKK